MTARAATPAPRCEGVKADGSRCRAAPLHGERWCRCHHPERRDQHRELSARGGAATWRRRLEETAATSSAGVAAILGCLVEILGELMSGRCGRSDVPRLRAATYTCSIAIEACRQVEFSGQLNELAAVIEQLQRGTTAGAVELPPTGTSAPWRRTDPA